MPRTQVASHGVFDFGAGAGPIIGTAASATVTLSTAVDGNTVTLSDGTTTVIFEFDNNVSVTGDNVLVDLGANDTAAAANLAAAINASDLLMSAESALGVVTITAVTTEFQEANGNAYTTAKVGVPVTVTDFTGGISGDATAVVLRFRLKPNQGGKLTLSFENADGIGDLTVSVEVATTPTGLSPSEADGGWTATTVANNLAAITSLAVPQRTSLEHTILLRRGIDLEMRVLAIGSARGQLLIREDALLEPIKI